MSVIEKLLEETAVPNMLRVRQVFDDTHIDPEQIPQTVVEQLSQEKISGTIRPGMRIAITVGSRGVANIALIVKSIVT